MTQSIGHLPLSVIQYPTGRWGFVGRVPAALSYAQKDGSAPTAKQLDAAAHCGPGFAGLKPRSWETRESAIAALSALPMDRIERQGYYFTVILTYSERPSAWHPRERTGPFAILSCGAFLSATAAHTWAEKHLGHENAYSIRLIDYYAD